MSDGSVRARSDSGSRPDPPLPRLGPPPSCWARGQSQPRRKPAGEHNPFPLRDRVSTEEWWILFKHCKRILFSLRFGVVFF